MGDESQTFAQVNSGRHIQIGQQTTVRELRLGMYRDSWTKVT